MLNNINSDRTDERLYCQFHFKGGGPMALCPNCKASADDGMRETCPSCGANFLCSGNRTEAVCNDRNCHSDYCNGCSKGCVLHVDGESECNPIYCQACLLLGCSARKRPYDTRYSVRRQKAIPDPSGAFIF